MRRLLLASAVLAGAACASPAPCTQALCPAARLDGSYRVTGWTGSVTVSPGTPALPIVSDASVEVLKGGAEFYNRRAVLRAAEGSSFRFSVSSDDAHVPAIVVGSGEVTVALSSTSAQTLVAPGATYLFPAPKK
jgi:hypothetical protein